ncbi:MAG TPA: LysR family transcriptional regulator [Microbacteriaceae bacterium]|nr:LysR family transcriptional regulator [Microbacteriaceae bacterium]
MNSRQLTVFLAVVDTGGVGKAARLLHVAQPSLSQTIRRLEAEAGVALFTRVGRRLALTPAGEALITPARMTVNGLDQAARALSDIRRLHAGRLDIAALSTLATVPVAGLIGRFRRQHPDVVVRLAAPETAGQVAQLVRDGTAELGFAETPLDEEGLSVRPLGTQRLVVVLPPGTAAKPAAHNHPDPCLPPILTLGELARLEWVAAPEGTSTRNLLEEALRTLGVTPRIAVETPHRDAIIPLVLAGAGATLLPETHAEDARAQGALIRATDPPVTRHVALLHRTGEPSPAATAFLNQGFAPGTGAQAGLGG